MFEYLVGTLCSNNYWQLFFIFFYSMDKKTVETTHKHCIKSCKYYAADLVFLMVRHIIIRLRKNDDDMTKKSLKSSLLQNTSATVIK